jgi:hypothetical protein
VERYDGRERPAPSRQPLRERQHRAVLENHAIGLEPRHLRPAERLLHARYRACTEQRRAQYESATRDYTELKQVALRHEYSSENL